MEDEKKDLEIENEPSAKLIRLPVVPLRNMVFFPGGTLPVVVGRDKTISAIEKAISQDGRIFLSTQKATDGEAESSNLFRIGTIGLIQQVIRLPNGIQKVIITGENRARVIRFSSNPSYLESWVELYPFPSFDIVEEEALSRRATSIFKEFVSISDNIPDDIIKGILLRSPGVMELANIILAHVKLPYKDLQNILEAESQKEMLTRVVEALNNELLLIRFDKELENKLSEKLTDAQRQFILRQKMAAIAEEIGDTSAAQQEIDEYGRKLKSKDIPKHARDAINREMERLSRMHPVSSEASVARTYIEWLLDLPWEQYSEENDDLELAEKILNEDHYDLKDVKKRILEHIALVRFTGKIKGPILCLVGPPGVGKTSLGKSVARAMGRRFVRISLGGMDDESEIRGHRRTYVGALPGRIIQAMRKTQSGNPVFLLDEVDKMGKSLHGDPASALLEVLDPEQNNAFTDNYLEVEYDLSRVLFITTANTLHGIPDATS
jgi:ATP-dependent Lon protease